MALRYFCQIVPWAVVCLFFQGPDATADRMKADSKGRSSSMKAMKKIILDTDIGDDIDDAFALALVLSSPELDLLGVTTAFGATEARARIACRMLYEAGRESIPVAMGRRHDTRPPQAPWAADFTLKRPVEQPATDFIIETLRRYPRQITLVPIGPLTNIADVFRKDPGVRPLIKEIILMGGSVSIGYNAEPRPSREWNIVADIESSKVVFSSGVPITMVGLDATATLRLEGENRAAIFKYQSPLTRALEALYRLWGHETPILFDPMAVACAIDKRFCTIRKMYIEVDDEGYTRAIPNRPPNVSVCVSSRQERFFAFYLDRILTQSLKRNDRKEENHGS